MNDTSFLGLVQNATLLLAVAFLFDVAASRWRVGQSSFWNALVGLALGAIGITVMLTPWTFGQGIVFDTRSVLLGISGLFFGFISTAIAMAMTAAFRFYQGGTGALTGIAVILTSGAIGIAWHHFRRRSLAKISWQELYFFGMVIHLAMLGLMLTLPWATALRVLSNIALPVILIYPLGTVLLGVLMVNRLRRESHEKALRESEEKYRWVVDNMADVITVIDMNLRFTYVSPSIIRLRGYTAEEATAQTFEQVMTPQSLQVIAKVFEEEMKLEASGTADPGRSRILELQQYKKDGSIVWMENNLSFIRDETQKPVSIISLSRDITDRKRAEEALLKSEEKFKTIFDRASDGILIADPVTKKFLQGNTTICSMLGYTKEEIESLTIHDIHPPEDIYRILDEFEKQLKGEKVLAEDLPVLRKDGSIFYADIGAAHTTIGGINYLIGIFRDITERRQADEALKESEEQYRNLFENANESIFVAQDGNLVFVNPMTAVMIGYPREELMAKSFIEFIHPDDQEMVIGRHVRRMRGEEIPHRYTFRIIHKDGNIRWVELNAVLINWKGKPATLNFLSDITEKVRAEEDSRRLASVVRHSRELVNLANPNGTMVFLNDAGKKLLGISEEDVAQTNIMNVIPEHLRDKVQQEVLPSVNRDGCWEGDLQYLNVKTGRLTDVHAITFKIVDPGTGTLQFLANVSQDITERKRAEEELQRTLESLRKAFGVTIQVMVSAVETRDPYTAGHQVRSANLARAIAAEMGLSQDTIDAIRMAGPIHDIGKLSIPAEILSKPTKLTNIEFSLIKEHVRTGYEMLKDVESPWPLAEIVYQHHERMNGSGYPRNLKGDKILMESRILAVSDVVESMASHRPYRPALGLNAALEEIETNKGTLYDADVVDACLRLFREKGFQLEGIRLS
jgi:PAS domain S-box-containing protein